MTAAARHCAFVSFRLGRTDGVSVVAAAWEQALRNLGWTTGRVAGDGDVDHLLPGLAIDAEEPPDEAALDAALADADLVVVENLLSIPLNLPASRVVAAVLAGRPTIVHHHDPPWQRERFAHVTELPVDDPAWHHVTINRLTEREFAERGLAATTVYNGFDTAPVPGRRAETRRALGIDDERPLAVHPVRAIARKDVPTALAIAADLDAAYWLPGPAEEDYAPVLDEVLASTAQPVLRTTPAELDLSPAATMSDLYAAADLVLFPSTWEGFGNPPMEAAVHRRPVVVGHYPVADELRALGFDWLDPDDGAGIAAAVAAPPTAMLDRNQELVEARFSLEVMAKGVEGVLAAAGF